MKESLDGKYMDKCLAKLDEVDAKFNAVYPGPSQERKPVHTLYGGAHLFKHDIAQKVSKLALNLFHEYAPNAVSLEEAFELPPKRGLSEKVFQRIEEKLTREALEDYRIDFEDGFGSRPDKEEDHFALVSAVELAKGIQKKCLPPFCGIRVKSLLGQNKYRSLRTLDIFLKTLVEHSHGVLPQNFVITLPKVIHKDQVEIFCDVLSEIEKNLAIPQGKFKIELMIEKSQSLFESDGDLAIPSFLKKGGGRVNSIHFGTYDFTSDWDITADYQAMDHSACDFAKYIMKASVAGRNIQLSDGATILLPIPPHKGEELSKEQKRENKVAVYRSWRKSYNNIRHSLKQGFFQGWDLHPGQLIARYGALYSFFQEGLEQSSSRLMNFISEMAQATRDGAIFDDEASAQGLLNFFLRAYDCQALEQSDFDKIGITIEELRTRSFKAIVENRKKY